MRYRPSARSTLHRAPWGYRLDLPEARAPSGSDALRSAFDEAQRQLGAERARAQKFRAAIAQHLGKGCRSQSLRLLLLEDDQRDTP